MLTITPLELQGAHLVELDPHTDERGSFARVFCRRDFEAIRPDLAFVQINRSRNRRAGTLRGMHYQQPPSAEAKLVGCSSGAALDVFVDIRTGSDTFLEHIAVELSSENNRMVFIPEGFAHGFQTLRDNTELMYYHTQFYDPTREAGINYADPRLAIDWPLDVVALSDKDRQRGMLSGNFQGVELP